MREIQRRCQIAFGTGERVLLDYKWNPVRQRPATKSSIKVCGVNTSVARRAPNCFGHVVSILQQHALPGEEAEKLRRARRINTSPLNQK